MTFTNLAAATTLPPTVSAAQGGTIKDTLGGVTIPARPSVAASSRAAGAPFWSMIAPANFHGAA